MAAADGERPRDQGPQPGGGPPPAEVVEPGRSLWWGLISLAIVVAIVAGLLLAVPDLHGVADAVSDMSGGWLLVAVGLEILSCVGYVVAFLEVFDPGPLLRHPAGPPQPAAEHRARRSRRRGTRLLARAAAVQRAAGGRPLAGPDSRLLTGTAASIRMTQQVMFTSDWRIVGAIAFL